ncbi:restriction endonuclease subunit S [Anaerobiospirillum thomasii]|uniref:Predicted nucleotidyltransferases n=1 Tax=Anaerobiospirillum thomasii TaxID=179995 RepID=A0A2X0WVC8_9GAMM|nr:restriction endonuclease subunit S [Anaerobiospirillum thomasii]SPT70442.1 Predicted nucleotidyltransferases [Anaerobiospirillum thomasii]
MLSKSRFIELIGDYDLSLKKKEWIYLKDLGEIVGGATPKTSDPLLWDGNFKWITPAELTESTYIITESERHLTQMGVKSCSLQTLPKGTVLLTSRAPIGKVAIAGVDMFCNQGFKNIICGKGLRAKYLCYLLKLNSRVRYP